MHLSALSIFSTLYKRFSFDIYFMNRLLHSHNQNTFVTLIKCTSIDIVPKMEKLDYWSVVNFLLQLQNSLSYSCLTNTKLHVHVVNRGIILHWNVTPNLWWREYHIFKNKLNKWMSGFRSYSVFFFCNFCILSMFKKWAKPGLFSNAKTNLTIPNW